MSFASAATKLWGSSVRRLSILGGVPRFLATAALISQSVDLETLAILSGRIFVPLDSASIILIGRLDKTALLASLPLKKRTLFSLTAFCTSSGAFFN